MAEARPVQLLTDAPMNAAAVEGAEVANSVLAPCDMLHTRASQLSVASAELDVIETCAVEVQLQDTRGSFLLAAQLWTPP